MMRVISKSQIFKKGKVATLLFLAQYYTLEHISADIVSCHLSVDLQSSLMDYISNNMYFTGVPVQYARDCVMEHYPVKMRNTLMNGKESYSKKFSLRN